MKLTEAQLERIRMRLAAGEKQAQIARDFGVSRMYVSLIAAGKRRPQITLAPDGDAASEEVKTFFERTRGTPPPSVRTRPGVTCCARPR